MTEDGLKAITLVSKNVVFGSLDGFDQQPGVAIGMGMAESLGVVQGGVITLVSPSGTTTPFGTAPRAKAYRVAAIFEMGMSEYDRTMVFIPLGEAQRYFSRGPEVDVIEIMTDNPETIDATIGRMQKVVGPGIGFSSWREKNQSFFTVLEVERTVMFIILSLIILVAALNIISGLMMLVKHKGRDIAILRTMGATKGAMMRVFLITGASIGVVGTLAGLVLGGAIVTYLSTYRFALDPRVYLIDHLPVVVTASEFVLTAVIALGICMVSTLAPSWWAARMLPVEGLRHE